MRESGPAQQAPNYGGWTSFEGEIRARRYSRCLQSAEAALDAGRLEEAREWIAEARELSPAADGLDELERRLATWSEPIASPLIAERFRDPDPGLRAEVDVLRPGEGAIFGASPVDERREVRAITVFFGMAAMALIVGAISFGVTRFLNGEPMEQLFNLSRSQKITVSTEPPVARTTPPEPEAKAPKPADPTPSAAPPSNSVAAAPASIARPVARSEEGATTVQPRSAPPKSAAESARVHTPRAPQTPTAAAVREQRNTPAAPTRPSSGWRLSLPAPPPTPEPVRPLDPPPVAAPVPTPTIAAAPRTTSEALPVATTGAVPAPPLVEAAPSPVPAPAPAPPSTRTASEARAADTVLVRTVLSRYEAAYNRLDARAASAVWPKVNEGALGRAFDGLLSQRVALGPCDVAVIGDIAGASCFGKARWEPKVGGGVQTADRHWKFNLRKMPDGWKIENILVQ